MARTSNSYYGPFGDKMFYREPGKQHPGHQSYKDIKNNNAIIASNAAESLRSGLYAVTPNASGNNVQNRLTRALANWLQAADVENLPPSDDIPFITDFQITTGCSFAERFRVPINIDYSEDHILTVSVNAFMPTKQVTAPEDTSLIELVVAVAGCDLGSGIGISTQVQREQVPYNNLEIAAQSLRFKVPGDKGILMVTGAWLQYYAIKNNSMKRLEDPDFLPACILRAQYN